MKANKANIMTETAKGLSRPLAKWEYAFWLLDHASCTNHAAIAEVSLEIDEEQLRMALDMVRKRHPMLQSRIVLNDKKKAVFIPDNSLEPVKLKVINSERWREEIAIQMDVAFTSEDCPLMRAILFHHEGYSLLALIFHHSIADATAGLSIAGEVLSYALGIEKEGRAGKEALPVMEQLFPGNVKGVSGLFKIARFGLSIATEVMEKDPLKLPFFRDASFLLRRLEILPVDIDPSISSAIMEKCKIEGATFHGALSAAMYLALKATYPSRKDPRFSIISPVSLRDRLKASVSPDDMGNLIGHLIVVREVAEDFWPLAKGVSDEMKDRIKKGEAHAVCLATPSSKFYPPTEKGVRKFNKLMFTHPHSQMISNMGKIDKNLTGDIPDLVNLYSLMSPHTRDGVSLCVSTFKDELTVNLVYAATALPPEMPHKLIRRFEQALRWASEK